MIIVARQQLIDAAHEAARSCACPDVVAGVENIRVDAPRLTVIEMATDAALSSVQCAKGCPALHPLVQLINSCVMESRRPLGLHVPRP